MAEAGEHWIVGAHPEGGEEDGQDSLESSLQLSPPPSFSHKRIPKVGVPSQESLWINQPSQNGDAGKSAGQESEC